MILVLSNDDECHEETRRDSNNLRENTEFFINPRFWIADTVRFIRSLVYLSKQLWNWEF